MNLLLRSVAAAAMTASLSTVALAETAEINFGVISTESAAEPEADLGPLPRRHGGGDRPQGQRLLRLRLCRRHRGHALRQGAGCLVRQQVGDGGGRPRQRRDLRPVGRRERRARLLLAPHRAGRQPARLARGRAQVRPVAQLRPRRSELDLGLPGADDLRLRQERRRSEDLLQDGDQRQPRDQRAGGRQQAGRRRRQQHREHDAASRRPTPRPPPRSR